MTDRLSIYNLAMLNMGERPLASLTEDREPRRIMDQVWNTGGVQTCLEEGQWFFAMRTSQIDYDTDVQPPFGYNRAFSKPDDWLLTCGVCSDEFFRVPLLRYSDEAGYWYSDLDTIFVKYVSNDALYGMDLSRWPMSFVEFVAAHFAAKAMLKMTNDDDRLKSMIALRQRALNEAKNKGLMAQPTQFPAQGNWSKSRQRWNARRDGGNYNTGGSLIG